jgi:hypothetical protein
MNCVTTLTHHFGRSSFEVLMYESGKVFISGGELMNVPCIFCVLCGVIGQISTKKRPPRLLGGLLSVARRH